MDNHEFLELPISTHHLGPACSLQGVLGLAFRRMPSVCLGLVLSFEGKLFFSGCLRLNFPTRKPQVNGPLGVFIGNSVAPKTKSVILRRDLIANVRLILRRPAWPSPLFERTPFWSASKETERTTAETEAILEGLIPCPKKGCRLSPLPANTEFHGKKREHPHTLGSNPFNLLANLIDVVCC